MIKVFNATDKNYATHGDLILQPSKAVVHKEDNGEFYLDLETPLNEKEYKNTTPEEGQTAEGTSFSIEVDTTKQYQVQTLKGQTSQSGTPTPSSPVPINITTGGQVVKVCENNLFNINASGTNYGINYTFDKSELSLNGTTTSSGTIFNNKNKGFMLKAGTYTISSTKEGSFTYNGKDTAIYLRKVIDDSTLFTLSRGNQYTNTTTFTLSEDTLVYAMVYTNGSGFVFDNYKIYFMLNSGTSALSYEKYNGNDYEINLGKNLCDIVLDSSVTGNITYKTYTLAPNTQYTVSTNTWVSSSYTANIFVSAGTSFSPSSATNGVNGSRTVTSDSNGHITIGYRNVNNSMDYASGNYWVQLEKGTQPTSYTPYKTPIYLGEIGNYKDYIFRNTTENPLYDSNLEEGQWYIHKEIGRVVLNGSESGWTFTTNGNAWFISGWANNNNAKVPTNNDTLSNSLSTYFQNITRNQVSNASQGFGIASSGAFNLKHPDFITSASQLSAFKTWLSTHNVEVYYVLNTPTNTLIEDEELINQLNSIELLEGLNNVNVSSPYLPAILQLKYNFTTAYSNVIKYIDYLAPNNILVANTPQGDQAFRITNIEKTRRKIKLRANHVFYDSLNYLIADSYVVDKNCNDALDHLNNATSDVSPFTTISDITNINSFRCVRKSLYEAIQVVLERWGGHLVRNDWTIGIYNEIGQDNGVTIRYAKNLKDISATYDWNDVVTKLLPVGKDGILLNEIDPDASIYVESATQYDIPYTKTVSFEQNDIVEDNYKDEDGTLDEDTYKQALVDDLHSQAMEYITNNYLPKVNYNLSANVEKVSDVGDRVEVIDEKLGINLMTNIISFEYDCILERYTQIEFGNFKPTLSNLMTQISINTEEQITANNQTLQITLNQELETATDRIWDALGNSYVIYEGDKILVVDTLPKEAATNVIMINNGGIAFSNNGINGTFSSAWTIDNVLNMEQINVINLTADLIKGGTLKLGSNLNQNGQIEVYDETNALIAELNKDGLKMYGADGSYVLMNNEVGFAGYDKNDNKIYWVDKDEFHMKKSVIEEEITLCNKMRFIPITIRDNNNNIINDGIGLVSVMGGEE